jgi:lysine-N-methylase
LGASHFDAKWRAASDRTDELARRSQEFRLPETRSPRLESRQQEIARRKLRQTRMILPAYSESFKCIGPACGDSCCQGWAVPIDRPAYEKYQTVQGPLRVLLDANLLLTPSDPNPAHYAKVRMPESQVCPFLNEGRLCQIQAEHGEEYLSVTCATYPRIQHTIDNLKGTALSLSCPEAARLVLLNPRLLPPAGAAGYQISWEDSGPGEAALLPYFWPIREFTIGLIQNRVYPLWQRLFLVGAFCRRLDALFSNECKPVGQRAGFPSLLRDFSAAVAAGGLRGAMEAIPADLGLQLDMVVRLTGLGSNRARINPRFMECVRAFAGGIGDGVEGTRESQIGRYRAAYSAVYAPFFTRHPHILENYLLNAVFARAFPFGLKDGGLQTHPETAREFALLATQFTLMKGLLIGVAGFYGQAFSVDHVIHTVQSASKHFEHHPEFLAQAHALLTSRGLENTPGLTMLLRN